MIERLKIIEERYNFLTEELMKPEVYNDYKKMTTLSKEKTSLETIVNAGKELNSLIEDIETAKEMSHDPEMSEFAHAEIENLIIKKEKLDPLKFNFS